MGEGREAGRCLHMALPSLLQTYTSPQGDSHALPKAPDIRNSNRFLFLGKKMGTLPVDSYCASACRHLSEGQLSHCCCQLNM